MPAAAGWEDERESYLAREAGLRGIARQCGGAALWPVMATMLQRPRDQPRTSER
jgi:hypothetical protein